MMAQNQILVQILPGYRIRTLREEKGLTRKELIQKIHDRNITAAKNDTVKIRFGVDMNPPQYASFEHKYRLLPAPYEVNLYDMPLCLPGKFMPFWRERGKTGLRGEISMIMSSIFPAMQL